MPLPSHSCSTNNPLTSCLSAAPVFNSYNSYNTYTQLTGNNQLLVTVL